MLKETETEETIDFVVTFLSLVAFQLGGWAPGHPWLHLCTVLSSTILMFKISVNVIKIGDNICCRICISMDI